MPDDIAWRCLVCGGELAPSSGEWWLKDQWLHAGTATEDGGKPKLPEPWREMALAWARRFAPDEVLRA